MRKWVRNALAVLLVALRAWSFIILSAVVLIGCGDRDPIDRIVRKESADPMFGWGMYSRIPLPATASPGELVSTALGQALTNITIVKVRQVHIRYKDVPDSPRDLFSYTAVLVDTSSGRKVVLFQIEPHSRLTNKGWWYKVYDL